MVYKPKQRQALKDATKKYRSKKLQHPAALAVPITLLIALMTFCFLHFVAGF